MRLDRGIIHATTQRLNPAALPRPCSWRFFISAVLLPGMAAITFGCRRNTYKNQSKTAANLNVAITTAPTPSTTFTPDAGLSTAKTATNEIIKGSLSDGMPGAQRRAFEQWLFSNRALGGAKWQEPVGHVPGQYVAKHKGDGTITLFSNK